jgi:hypothetical protein
MITKMVNFEKEEEEKAKLNSEEPEKEATVISPSKSKREK